MRSTIQSESCAKGFTLSESLIAITLVVLLVGFALSAYALASQSLTRWDRKATIEDAAQVITQRLTLDLLKATRVRVSSPDSLVVWSGQTQTTFSAGGRALYRGGVRTHREVVKVTAFDVWAEAPSGARLSRADTEADEVSLVGVRLGLALDTLTAEREVRIALRSVPSWP